MSFLAKKEDKPKSESVSIRFDRPVLERLDRYQEFSNRGSRSEVVNDILRKVFDTDEEFASYKSNGSGAKRERKGTRDGKPDGKTDCKSDGSVDGSGTVSAEVRGAD